jgi:hypothetical protein
MTSASDTTAAPGAEPEVFMLLAGVSGVAVAASAALTRLVSGRRFNLFRYMEFGWLLALLIPLALLLPLVAGRRVEFYTNLVYTPGAMLQLAMEGRSYREGCVDGVCPFYCCHDPRNSAVRWKDCDPKCGSVVGGFGDVTGANCQHDADRVTQCRATGAGDGFVAAPDDRAPVCNHLPELGRITCTCCSAPGGTMFWDCSPACINHPTLQGFQMRQDECKGVAARFCKGYEPTVGGNEVHFG